MTDVFQCDKCRKYLPHQEKYVICGDKYGGFYRSYDLCRICRDEFMKWLDRDPKTMERFPNI